MTTPHDTRKARRILNLRQAFRSAMFFRQRQDVFAEKLVSSRHRFVWLCNPKAASRAIKSTLLAMDPALRIHHEPLHAIIAAHPEIADYFTFAFVRHPYDRALSFHTELWSAHLRYTDPFHVEQKTRKRRLLLARYPGLAETSDFRDYCRWLHTPYGDDKHADRHFLSQHVLIRREEGGSLPDLVGTLENLTADFQRVIDQLRLPARKLPILNTVLDHVAAEPALRAARQERHRHLSSDCKQLLFARYQEDFSIGRYEP